MQIDTTQPEPPPPSNAFMDFLRQHRNGASMTDLSEALQLACAQARETGKVAQFQYTVIITPSGIGAAVVTDKVATKLPELDRDKSIFFFTEANTLSRSNPAQAELVLREVEKPDPVQLRDVTAANQ